MNLPYQPQSHQCDTESIYQFHSECIEMKHVDRLQSIVETVQAFYPSHGHVRCCRLVDQTSWRLFPDAVGRINCRFRLEMEIQPPHQLQTTKFAEDKQPNQIYIKGKKENPINFISLFNFFIHS